MFSPFSLVIPYPLNFLNCTARKRNKTLIAQLQLQVEELTKDKAELKRSNDLMRTQLELLEQQNRTLLMNQISTQPPSQINSRNLMPGSNIVSASTFVGNGMLPNTGLINAPGNVGQIMGGNMNNHMLDMSQQAAYDTGGNVGNSGVIGLGSSGMGLGTTTNAANMMSNSLESLSFLERIRLQQQLQLQWQHQQLSAQMAPGATGSSNHLPMNDQDLLNNMRNNNNNST
jgi:hypothetical protein